MKHVLIKREERTLQVNTFRLLIGLSLLLPSSSGRIPKHLR